jgi:hypothetical protein
MPALPTAPPPNLVDERRALRTQAVLESAPSAVKIDARSAPRLITEHEVAFSTAAAVPMPSTRWWMGATRVVAVATRRIARTSADSRPKRRHYPRRCRYRLRIRDHISRIAATRALSCSLSMRSATSHRGADDIARRIPRPARLHDLSHTRPRNGIARLVVRTADHVPAGDLAPHCRVDREHDRPKEQLAVPD